MYVLMMQHHYTKLSNYICSGKALLYKVLHEVWRGSAESPQSALQPQLPPYWLC